MKERFECLEFALQHETALRNSIRGSEALSIFELAELVVQFVDGTTAKDVVKTAKSIQNQRIVDALEETRRQYSKSKVEHFTEPLKNDPWAEREEQSRQSWFNP